MKKYLFSAIYLILFSFASAAQTESSFSCQQVSENIKRIVYHSNDENFSFQASDAVLLKPIGDCKYCIVNTHEIQIPKKNISIKPRPEGDGFLVSLSEGEKIYGGGGRALPLQRRGYAFPLNNNPWYGYSLGADHLNFSVPFFISSKGYGLFFDNPSKGFVDIGKTNPDILDVHFSGGALHLYIIEGKNPQEILNAYHLLTGRQEMVPKWSMGLFMSRFGYTDEAQVKAIAKEMEIKKFPFDAVIFDLFWFGDGIKATMGNLSWVNKNAWPNPEKMISAFAKKGRKTILITEPFFLNTSLTYGESRPFLAKNKNGDPYELQDFYFGQGGLIDIFRRDSRDWFLTKYEKQIELGVAGWWGDLGEPEKHPEDMFHDLSDMGGKRLTPADHIHNIYGHTWTKMLYEYYQKRNPNYKLFSLNRSGFAGSQRYGIIPWTGDVSRSWEGLKSQLPLITGMSMSGIPYIHSDAGGFAGGDKDPELYTRWFQFSVFTPILRPHGTAVYDKDPGAVSYPSEPALIGGEWEPILRKNVHLRYEMLPYNYNLAFLHYVYGEPLIAPLMYHFPDDPEVIKYENQFMWGKDILVAPVLEKGIKQMDIYLPKGHQWYTFLAKFYGNNIQKISGHQTIDLVSENVPVFVKEGSFIVLSGVKKGKTTKDFDKGFIEIHYYYSDKTSVSEWYDDDGNDRLAYANGHYDLLKFSAEKMGKKTIIQIDSDNLGRKGWRAKRKIKLFLHGFDINHEVYCNDKKLKRQKDGSVLFYHKTSQKYNIEVVGK